MANTTQAQPTITHTGHFYIGCPYCGAEYSADASDYFMARDSAPFTCDCTGEAEPEHLYEVLSITGELENGNLYYGRVRTVAIEAVTVGDLRALEGK